MRSRWAYGLLVVFGSLLGVAIAGVPSSHHDTPLHVLATTTTTEAPTTSTTAAPAPPAPREPATTSTTARRR